MEAAVLYFASSAAQVWATLMVFHVLLIRDLGLYRDKESRAICEQGRVWLGALLTDGYKERLTAFSKRIGEDIFRSLVHAAQGESDAVERLLRAVGLHKLYLAEKVAGVINGVAYTPEELQACIDALVIRLDTVDQRYPEPHAAFYAGVAALAFNLLALAVFGLSGGTAWLLGLLVAANLVLGGQFFGQIRRAPTRY